MMASPEASDNQTYGGSTTDPTADSAKGLKVIQNISAKDGIVIGFVLSVWLYSLYLMWR